MDAQIELRLKSPVIVGSTLVTLIKFTRLKFSNDVFGI